MVAGRFFLRFWVICLVLPAGLTNVYADNPYSGDVISAITSPSKDVTLTFVHPGRIAKVYVKDGEMVKAGQLLIQLDDSVEQAQLAQLEAQSRDTTQIQAAEAELDQKRVDLKKLEWAAERGAATELEVQHARLDVKIAELSHQLARFRHEQDKRKHAEAKIQIDMMRLTSPVAGRIEKIFVEPGESVDGLADVVRVVEIDPLWIDIPVPLARAKTLRCGQAAKVEFPAPNGTSTQGKIIFVATVADAASGTLTVRVEVPNKSNRPAGEHIRVVFSDPAESRKSKR